MFGVSTGTDSRNRLMISTTAEYAVRAVLLLALRGEGASLRADEIADAIDAPRNYLSKTLRLLAQAGLVNGVRGPNGGFRLAADPRDITVAMLVDLFDPSRDSNGCLVPDCRCTPRMPCAVHRWWKEVEGASRSKLESTSVVQLMRRRAGDRGRVRSAIPATRASR